MEALSLTLQLDVYCIIIQLSEVLPKLNTCLFHASGT